MPILSITGDVDPFLHVRLRQGETIYCEADGMVTMDATLDLKGKVKGGLIRALVRRFAQDESFFQQHIASTRGDGVCLLAPVLPGAIRIVECGTSQYVVADGAFVAATDGVAMRVRMQGLGNALFAGNGGFFVGETSGTGQLAVSGFGAIGVLQVEPDKDLIVDNSHLVAWDSTLRYHVSVTTGGGGLLGGLINSQISGEGIVLRFSGSGKVLVCSRNREAFRAWSQPKAAKTK